MGAAACNSPYESARNQRIEENKRRMQELGLTDLSRDLYSSASPTTPSPGHGCRGKPRVLKEKVKVQLRRSTRNAGGPQPDYVEVEIDIRRRARFDNTGGTRHYSRLYERKYASEEARMSATEKAEALKKMLPQTHASFVKPMLQSHVTGGFWLGLPVAFCRDFLPKKDERIILEDENNEEWETIYLSNKTGLSGGWRGFSLDHGLVDGDALVFELVEPKRFKVHIIRVYGNSSTPEHIDSDVKEQEPESVEVSSNKVRQRLIWEKIPKKESEASDMTNEKMQIIDVRGDDSIRQTKERLNDQHGSSNPANADIKSDALHCNRLKRLKTGGSDDTAKKETEMDIDGGGSDVILVKKEVETGIEGCGLNEVVKNACKQSRDIASYMRSKKHADVNLKKEMRTGNGGGVGVC